MSVNWTEIVQETLFYKLIDQNWWRYLALLDERLIRYQQLPQGGSITFPPASLNYRCVFSIGYHSTHNKMLVLIWNQVSRNETHWITTVPCSLCTPCDPLSTSLRWASWAALPVRAPAFSAPASSSCSSVSHYSSPSSDALSPETKKQCKAVLMLQWTVVSLHIQPSTIAIFNSNRIILIPLPSSGPPLPS